MEDLKAISEALTKIVEYAGVMARRMRPSIQIRLKSDDSIVTEADIHVEAWLKDQLAKLIPGANFWGEESGFQEPNDIGLWLVDPIDGTSNYAYGLPLWGVSVAFYQAGKIILSAISLPDLEEVYGSMHGQGASLNGKLLPPITSGPIEKHHLMAYAEELRVKFPKTVWPGKVRCIGSFVVDAMFVSAGRLRGLVNHNIRFYDIAAAIGIAREVGALVQYANGDPLLEQNLLTEKKIDKPMVILPPKTGFEFYG